MLFCWPGRIRTCDLLIQSQAFYQTELPANAALDGSGRGRTLARGCATPTRRFSHPDDTVTNAMGSLVKKRRKRMRKKKHRKMLKRTRAQRQRGK